MGKRKDVLVMNYVIKNKQNVFIKLNKNGAPVTCTEHEKTLFEYSKATNIVNSLPKTLKMFQFKVEPVPEITPQENKEVIENIKQSVIENGDYELSATVSRWIDKFGECFDVLANAKQILKESKIALENTDKELLDILHSIELESSKDLYSGWKAYKRIKENRKRRRIIKDEILIIENVLEKIDPSCLQREQIQKAIDGLFTRKYRFRIVEEDDKDAM